MIWADTVDKEVTGKNQYTVVGGYHCDPRDPDAQFRDSKWSEPGDLEVLRSYYKVCWMTYSH